MICPKCKSQNVNVAFVQSGARTSTRGTGLIGNTNNATRLVMAMTSFGMSNLVWRKSKGTHKTRTRNVKKALCQDCGNDWRIR